MSGAIRTLLLLPHIRIHNANALSSPYTIGFPAMTAWLGAVHAMQRKIQSYLSTVEFVATGVVCHSISLQIYKGPNDFVSSIIGTGNPLEPKSEKNNPGNAVRSSFIEEARCHLDVSLIIEVSGLDIDDHDLLCKRVSQSLHTMKIAGGDINQFAAPFIRKIEDGNDKDMAQLNRRLMPGYVLIERRELMAQSMEEGQDALEAILDYLAIHHHCERNDQEEVVWSSHRKKQPQKNDEPAKPAGWIVPIATGFHGITPIGEAKNQRDPETPHCFAESVVTLGEFKMPYRVKSVDEMLWRYHFNEASSLYLCQQITNDTGSVSNIDYY
ncbi:type I-F CRISPR-associated protein Csy2 [uncultured Endozoicomonas sp.]|uniref:type I-F CRISPR-associated protein Csy2 n=1 Tax=uncultured Endozoicomonas sp. TaxID=432652 RepID=UPI0026215F5A|nr:type I-F CRISPR-associated protein Csy2 [uncultured Endozoicomonas sp.]